MDFLHSLSEDEANTRPAYTTIRTINLTTLAFRTIKSKNDQESPIRQDFPESSVFWFPSRNLCPYQQLLGFNSCGAKLIITVCGVCAVDWRSEGLAARFFEVEGSRVAEILQRTTMRILQDFDWLNLG